ncbi:MAG: Peptidyl-Dipeptidase [Ignavibacteria bacterium]|nr:Peptidyl-Dipeptidase [Ignavibacteria bacterium]
MRRFLTSISLLLTIPLLLTISSCKKMDNAEAQKKAETEFAAFQKEYVGKLKPVTIGWFTADFEAAVSGEPADFARSDSFQMIYNKLVSDKAGFAKLKAWNDSGMVRDTSLARSLLLIYNEYLSKQIDTNKLNAMTKLQTEIVQKFNKFRADVDGKQLSDNEIEEVLKTSTESKELQATYEAHKKIGPLVADDIIKLVKMRNEAARQLGFKNYHQMSLTLSEQDPEEISKLFDELDNLTREPFKQLKTEIDNVLSKRCNIKPEEMQPWHYQNRYFQEAPKIYDIDVDTYYKDKDIIATTENYYKSLNLLIGDIIPKCDLYPKPKKNQHAFCSTIDRDIADIRVLCNTDKSARWMETNLHEFGHALYDKFYSAETHWIQKQPAHIFTTEAIAMLFGRFATNPQWMQDVIGISVEEKTKIADMCHKVLRLQQLCFSRWSQVMYRFEKSMYDNPDQDLNKLWWDLVEKYQMVKKPAGRNMPDWATKTHIASAPCYYHNYHLGELLASQLYNTLCDKVLKVKSTEYPSFYGKPEVGKYLIAHVFSVGAKYNWNEMIERATGEKLTPKYYAAQFVK